MSPNVETCARCQTAVCIIRRLGFQDSISWGPLGGQNQHLHATHANAGRHQERAETEDEYKRRTREHPTNKLPFGQMIGEYTRQPLCVFYSNELAWLSAGRPMRTTVYMAHPVSGPEFHDNIRNATRWLQFLRRLPQSTMNELVGHEYIQRPLILCPWLAGIEEDEMYPGGREGVIMDSRDAVMLFDEVWLVGGKVTSGIHVEAKTARIIRDLTHLGPTPNAPRK